MLTATTVRVVNRLISLLPINERQRILQRCESVELAVGTILCEPGEPFRHVYFPSTGFISLVSTMIGHQPLNMRLIGNEGMLGVTLVLGLNTASMRAVVQGVGTALRMDAKHFTNELRQNASLRPLLNRYLYVLMAQLSQNAACTHFHEIEPRLARCLLMTHDRAQADHFYLTHEMLADMLGVRRSGVSVAAGALQFRHLIHYSRGDIRILDRPGLEAAACACYQLGIEEYKRVLS